MLEHLISSGASRRAEGKQARDTLGDVGAGVAGAVIMALAWLTPFLRSARNQWGLSADEASAPRPRDELVPSLLEPVGFAMDRRMLLGIRDRVLATKGEHGDA